MNKSTRNWSTRSSVLFGVAGLMFLAVSLGVWATHSVLAGAVIARGSIEVQQNRQVVQHPEGGIVGQILRRDGDRVEALDTILRLDDTILRSEMAALTAQLVELEARRVRLEAERDGKDKLEIPPELRRSAASNADTAQQVEGQIRLFEARNRSLAQNRSELNEQIRQSNARIRGLVAQRGAFGEQAKLLSEEIRVQADLLDRGLAQGQKVSAMKREAARLNGEMGRLDADIAGLRGEISQLELRKLGLLNDRRETAITTLRDIQFRTFELTEERGQLGERLKRLVVRAPTSGLIHDSKVHAQSAVIKAGETLMFIVPQNSPLHVEARVDAIHIDQVFKGQPATLRFTAFDQRITPEMSGEVLHISADAFVDESTGIAYYKVRILPDPHSQNTIDLQTLVPGMPVETFLRTADRTPMSYVLKPIRDYFSRALREG